MKFQIYISIPQYNNYKSGLIVIPFAAEQFSKRFNMPSITTTTFRPTTPIGWPQPQPSIRLAQQLRLRRVKAEVEARLRQVEDIIQIHRLMSKLNNCTHFLFSDDAKYSLWPPEVRAFCAWPRTLTSAYLGNVPLSLHTQEIWSKHLVTVRNNPEQQKQGWYYLTSHSPSSSPSLKVLSS